jgi:hypothetical protein
VGMMMSLDLLYAFFFWCTRYIYPKLIFFIPVSTHPELVFSDLMHVVILTFQTLTLSGTHCNSEWQVNVAEPRSQLEMEATSTIYERLAQSSEEEQS